MELCEYSISVFCDDCSMKEDNPAKVYVDNVREAMIKMGRPPPTRVSMKAFLEKAGFKDVVTSEAKEPIGPWPKNPKAKRLGAMVLLHSETVFESYGIAAFTRILGMNVEKAKAICDA